MDYLIEYDDESPLIDFLAGKIADYEDTCEDFAEFNNSITETSVGVALLRTLIDQYKLSYSDLKNEIGSKSLISQILSGQRALTMKWHTEFGHLNRGDMLTSEQHRCSNEKKKFQRRV